MSGDHGLLYLSLIKFKAMSRLILFIAECLYSRRHKGVFYARDPGVMIQALYDFGYIHYQTMQEPNALLHMTAMKDEIMKRQKLQKHLRCTSLSHMANRLKDAKDVYFGTLCHDIATYAKH